MFGIYKAPASNKAGFVERSAIVVGECLDGNKRKQLTVKVFMPDGRDYVSSARLANRSRDGAGTFEPA